MKRDYLVAVLAFASFGLGSCRDGGAGHPFRVGRSSGVDAPLSADSTHAFAGRVGEGMLPTVAGEPEELRVWAQGDFILANDRIAIVVEDAGPSDHFDPWGGKVVGLARVVDGGMVEPAQFNEASITIGRHTVQTESVGILDDGRDGSDAIVRAIGRLAPIPFIDDTIRALFKRDYDDVWVAVDYVLSPGAESFDIRYSFAAADGFAVVAEPLLIFALQGSTMPGFSENFGFAVPSGTLRWSGFVTPGGTGYAFEMLATDHRNGSIGLRPSAAIAGANIFYGAETFVGPEDPDVAAPMARVHVGGPDVDGLVRAIARNLGEGQRTITGTVTESNGTTPAVGVDVHAEIDADHYLTRATTGADGSFTLHVPASAAVQLHAFRRGNELVGPVAVAASETTATIAFPPTGWLHLSIRDADSNAPIPAKVQIRPATGEPAIPARFGVEGQGAGRVFQRFPLSGELTVPLTVGSHHVTVSRGFEYDIVSTDVTIGAGATFDLTAPLSRDVATPGVLCGDFHIHTNRSPDAPDGADLKLSSAVAEGLELPVRSDHEWTTDFEPVIARMGLGAYAYGLSSLELTTYWWGHFGVFPLAERFDRPNGGAITWYDSESGPGYLHRTPIEVFEDVHSVDDPVYGPAAIIINHPRSTDTPVVGKAFAYFAAMGYDPITGAWAEPTHDERFQLIEAFNDSDFDANYNAGTVTADTSRAVNDWFSFLDRGLDMFAVGSSDSHGITGSPVGYPRTCIELGTDDPDAIRGEPNGPGRIRDQLLAGRMTVSGGIYVNAWARYSGGSGQGPGSHVTGAAANETVRVRVQAAPWVDADRLRVFVDGALVQTIPLDGSSPGYAAPATRFESDIVVPVASGRRSYVILVADGSDPMTDAYPSGAAGREPFGVTNPIFFER